MGLICAEKAKFFFNKKIDHKNVQYCNLVHAQKPKFRLPAPFFYSRYFLRFVFSLAAVKSWVLIMGKA